METSRGLDVIDPRHPQQVRGVHVAALGACVRGVEAFFTLLPIATLTVARLTTCVLRTPATTTPLAPRRFPGTVGLLGARRLTLLLIVLPRRVGFEATLFGVGLVGHLQVLLHTRVEVELPPRHTQGLLVPHLGDLEILTELAVVQEFAVALALEPDACVMFEDALDRFLGLLAARLLGVELGIDLGLGLSSLLGFFGLSTRLFFLGLTLGAQGLEVGGRGTVHTAPAVVDATSHAAVAVFDHHRLVPAEAAQGVVQAQHGDGDVLVEEDVTEAELCQHALVTDHDSESVLGFLEGNLQQFVARTGHPLHATFLVVAAGVGPAELPEVGDQFASNKAVFADREGSGRTHENSFSAPQRH